MKPKAEQTKQPEPAPLARPIMDQLEHIIAEDMAKTAPYLMVLTVGGNC